MEKQRYTDRLNVYQSSTYWVSKTKLKYYLRSIKSLLLNKVYPDYLFVATRIKGYTMASWKTKIVPIHVHEYDEFLKYKNLDEVNKAVFLSSDLPHHIETKKFDINKTKYYKEINTYLKWFKKKYDVEKVVVCEHPNAYIDKVQKFWKYGAKKNKTAKEVAESKYVISMGSGATLYAIMAKKPLVTLRASEVEKHDLVDRCTSYENRLKCSPALVEGSKILYGGSLSDLSLYENVFHSCIKQRGTPDVNSFEFMYDFLEEEL